MFTTLREIPRPQEGRTWQTGPSYQVTTRGGQRGDAVVTMVTMIDGFYGYRVGYRGCSKLHFVGYCVRRPVGRRVLDVLLKDLFNGAVFMLSWC